MRLTTFKMRHETKDTRTKCDQITSKPVKVVRTPHPKNGAYYDMTQKEP